MSKAILITGGTGTLGKELIKFYYLKGFEVLFTSRQHKKANDLIATLPLDNTLIQPKFIETDFLSEDAVSKICLYFSNNNISCEYLINNARSVDYLEQADHLPTRENWLNEYTIDVVIPYQLSFGLLNSGSKLKSVVNVASIYGVIAARPDIYENYSSDSPVHYSVAKAAQIHMSKELAIRLASYNVNVNSVSPAGFGSMPKEFKERYLAHNPQKRVLRTEEVVSAIAFLTSEEASGITGHNLIVDGGWSVW